ncbi:hypothetical protein GOBAR_AA37969 [Gossypium barbadense]|nr:hypothetical protein GOBAR_AA37969 [Gossypium barbadense]
MKTSTTLPWYWNSFHNHIQCILAERLLTNTVTIPRTQYMVEITGTTEYFAGETQEKPYDRGMSVTTMKVQRMIQSRWLQVVGQPKESNGDVGRQLQDARR